MSNKDQQEEIVKEEVQNENTQEQAEQEGNKQETENSSETEVVEEDEITLLKKQVEEANNKYLRLYSDFENFRRRNSKERLELMQSAGSDIIKELLPILDDFDRASASNKELKDVEAVQEGFELIQNKLKNMLTSKGLKPMATEAGSDFDVDKHEAITNIPAPDKKLKGKVMDVIEKGYLLNDKVIRYAKVVVGQ